MKIEWHDTLTDPPNEGQLVWLYHPNSIDPSVKLARFDDGEYTWGTLTYVVPEPSAWTPLVPPAPPVRGWISSEGEST